MRVVRRSRTVVNLMVVSMGLAFAVILMGLLALALMLSSYVNAATLYPTIPGTNTPDRGNPMMTGEGDTLYPVIPGTNTPDRGSDSRLILEDGNAYPTVPGTNTPDRSRRRWSIED